MCVCARTRKEWRKEKRKRGRESGREECVCAREHVSESMNTRRNGEGKKRKRKRRREGDRKCGSAAARL